MLYIRVQSSAIVNSHLSAFSCCIGKSTITEMQKYDKDDFVSYNSEQGLDSFWCGCIGEKPKYSKLRENFRILLILSFPMVSHVEKRFSGNKDNKVRP